jgi:HAE1 family hydrophobic/amphiphilic exporter-1
VLGLSVSDIAQVMQTAVEGKVASKFKKDGREINIRVRLRENDRKDSSSLSKLLIHSPSGQDITLTDIAAIIAGRGPTQVAHENKERTVKVWANLERRGVDSAVREIERGIIAKLNLKKGYSVKIAGEVLQMKESFMGLMFAVLLSLILVYMVMAAQFENLSQPFIIMFTVPLALIGVAGALFLTFTKVSVMVFLGIIVLGGVVVNNGIVLVDCINRLRREGYAIKTAVVDACGMRFRPIIMTAATSVLGLIPLGLGLSAGAKLQQPMAITIMAGLTVSTFLSLVVIPIIYLNTQKD